MSSSPGLRHHAGVSDAANDPTDSTRTAWAVASHKYVREHEQHLEEARSVRLLPSEETVLAGLLPGADVVHPMSGNGLDDHAMVRLGARSVLGLDYTENAVRSAQARADELGVPCRYLRRTLPETGLPDASADLVYTGKGALPWIADLDAWVAEMRRILRRGGHLFVHDAHPLVPMWGWDPDGIEIRSDRSYFAPSHVNDSFPANGAVEHQRTLAEIVMAFTGDGLRLLHLAEHPDNFWAPGDVRPAAWGPLPNAVSVLVQRED